MTTKKQAVQMFKSEIVPILNKQYGRNDVVARREAWNNYVDHLEKDGSISQVQAYTWTNPF
jgi:hypothetical protein